MQTHTHTHTKKNEPQFITETQNKEKKWKKQRKCFEHNPYSLFLLICWTQREFLLCFVFFVFISLAFFPSCCLRQAESVKLIWPDWWLCDLFLRIGFGPTSPNVSTVWSPWWINSSKVTTANQSQRRSNSLLMSSPHTTQVKRCLRRFTCKAYSLELKRLNWVQVFPFSWVLVCIFL